MITQSRSRRSRSDRPQVAQTFDDMRSDYQAAKSSRFRRRRSGVSLNGSGADYHYRSEADYLRLIEQARDMDRNDVIVGSTIDKAVTHTIQQGFTLDVSTGEDSVDTLLAEKWEQFANAADACDIAGELTFCEMEALVFRHMLVDGDLFSINTEDGPIQLIEGHRCRTPKDAKKNIVHGIVMDGRRKREQFWFTRDDIDPMASMMNGVGFRAYPARDADGMRQICQIYNPKRATQTRGVTAFAPIFDTLGMFEDINFAKLLQQQIVSCFAIFREREAGAAGNFPGSDQFGTQTFETQADGSIRTIEGIGPGMMIDGQPGEKLQGFSPNVPNAEFFDHVRLMLTLVGINLGLPLVMVLMDAKETNFSGFRGALDQARMGFRRNQRSLINKFHTPTYRWKVAQWITEEPLLAEAVARGVNVFRHAWHPPTWPYIEPLKDATADVVRLKSALISPRRRSAERGIDWNVLVDEIVADNEYAITKARDAARRLNSSAVEDEERVHWRELMALPLPDGFSVTVGASSNSAPDPQDPQEA